MGITIISAKQFATKLKATVQKSGRLGFTAETGKALGLECGKFAKFAKDDEKGILYLIIIEVGNEDAFPIRENGGYYFIPTRQMFDALGMDYATYNIMFDLVRQPSLDADLQGQVYFMKQRQNKRKDKDEKDEDIIEP